MVTAGQRRGADTKAAIRAVAIELFTEKGYEATSLREIAERLEITKAALYYHFSSKESIVASIFEAHLASLDEMVAWAKEQPPGPDLRVQMVDRMVDMVTGEGLPAMRFAMANQQVVRDLKPHPGKGFDRFTELFDLVTGPDATLEETLRIRAALLSVNVVLMAARDLNATDEEIAKVARDIAHQLIKD
ncbi:helix-turn-helix domain-containing protein [Actinoplanes sp. NPDC051851]|uniref:TetR/AcrR family transcriptional regulator n=1 Tax=Actinoplanes sp. NPDC051851 TaxID=3154753 RepID=UPI003446B62B